MVSQSVVDLLAKAHNRVDQTLHDIVEPIMACRPLSKGGSENVNQAIDVLGGMLEDRDFETEVITVDGVTGDGHPIPHFLWARDRDYDPALPTVGFYGHVDGVEAKPWMIGERERDPHTVTEHEGFLYGRQMVDMVGAIGGWITAVDLARETYGKTCNVVMFFEGGEEIGSPKVGDATEQVKDKLQAGVFLVPDAPTSDREKVAVIKTLRGNIVGGSEYEDPLEMCERAVSLTDPRDVRKRLLFDGAYDGITGIQEHLDPVYEEAQRDALPKGALPYAPKGRSALQARVCDPALSTTKLRYARQELTGDGNTYCERSEQWV